MKLEFHEAPVIGISWKWYCIDGNTYDGAEDSHPIDKVIGYGETKLEAAEDWLNTMLDLASLEWDEEQAFKSEYVVQLKLAAVE